VNKGGLWREQFVKTYTKQDHEIIRAERFRLKDGVGELLPMSRLWKCMRWRIPGKDQEVKVSKKHGKAFLSGFQCCGSVWGCPVCAPKITERRKIEVSEAMKSADQMGFKVYLVTFTVPHGMGDDVKEIRKKLLKAFSRLNQTRAGREAYKKIGRVGWIRNLEVTYGENGFHPHIHALFFLDTVLKPKEVESILSPLWIDACIKSGLDEPSQTHGLRVDDGSKAQKYLTKWGLEHEITKGHLKNGKKSLTPWDFLRIYVHGSSNVSPDLISICQKLGIDKDKAGQLWLVFFYGFKGARQLYWSNGLRALLGLGEEKTDQELAEEQEDLEAETIATLDLSNISALHYFSKIPTLLTLAENDPSKVLPFLQDLTIKYQNMRTCY
jgi:hypothetical protein